jgi:hypothetical protein
VNDESCGLVLCRGAQINRNRNCRNVKGRRNLAHSWPTFEWNGRTTTRNGARTCGDTCRELSLGWVRSVWPLPRPPSPSTPAPSPTSPAGPPRSTGGRRPTCGASLRLAGAFGLPPPLRHPVPSVALPLSALLSSPTWPAAPRQSADVPAPTHGAARRGRHSFGRSFSFPCSPP